MAHCSLMVYSDVPPQSAISFWVTRLPLDSAIDRAASAEYTAAAARAHGLLPAMAILSEFDSRSSASDRTALK